MYAMMSDSENRKNLTFEQAEGVQPIPPQLKLKELSRGLRAALWHELFQSLSASAQRGFERSYLGEPWIIILRDMHALRDQRASDEFSTDFLEHIEKIKHIILEGNYVQVFGWLQWVLRHQYCPPGLVTKVAAALERERAAYRVVDGNTICPIGSEAELATIQRAFVDLADTEYHGARAHLRKAAAELTAGKFADSVRESIHAVESMAKSLEPSGELSKALAKLEESIKIHGAMKSGFGSLYGYTSDHEGIRHALLNAEESQVDEADALFMIGACAAFVSYLVNKGRAAGLI
jgi:hypothetical protein